MIRSRSIPRAVGKWVTIASAILGLGCATRQLIYPAPEWNTPLPSGVSSNAKQFLSDVSMVRLADSVHVRPRAGACLYCTVYVKIQAIGETWRINPDTGPAMGVPVARIQNLDSTDREAVYGFLPDTAAVYYLWVDRRPGSTQARLTVLQVPVHGGVVRAGHQKDLRLCHYRPAGQKPTSDADFREYRYHGDCTVPGSAASPGMSEASLFPDAPVAALVSRFAAIIGRSMMSSQGGWIDCNSGCCT
jgi:hypothetical protein